MKVPFHLSWERTLLRQITTGTNEEIKGFCFTKYSLTFPLFSKISVKGSDKHPLYRTKPTSEEIVRDIERTVGEK